MYVNNFFSCLEKTNLNMWYVILPFLIVNYIPNKKMIKLTVFYIQITYNAMLNQSVYSKVT